MQTRCLQGERPRNVRVRHKTGEEYIKQSLSHHTTTPALMRFPIEEFAAGSQDQRLDGPPSKERVLTTNQSIPSFRPFPSIAEHATILQFRSRSSPSFRASEISPAPLAPGWSCLLAKTNRAASRSSSSFSMAASSSAAVPSRSISVESITKTTAAVLA